MICVLGRNAPVISRTFQIPRLLILLDTVTCLEIKPLEPTICVPRTPDVIEETVRKIDYKLRDTWSFQ